ncbi:hypothetical protein ZHAS_00013884 [Anopheles sinensis]|uniref:Uncharacterized protein n=1 Tax=Anopheles sinensis TaxID=74873 RepID=A0A084W6S7_ANOSI|nr:hypothetical protein ZHAS_00013884 [Anopheles sinensis]
MLVALGLVFACILRIETRAAPSYVDGSNGTHVQDQPSQTAILPTILPPEQIYHPESLPHGVVRYQHLINNSPSSNYFVYYTDNIVDQPRQQYVNGYSISGNDPVSGQIVYSPNAVPIQLVTLVQPSIGTPSAQEQEPIDSKQEETEEALEGVSRGKVDVDEVGIQKLVSSTQNLVSNEDVVDINNAQEGVVTERVESASNVSAKAEDSVPGESQRVQNTLAQPGSLADQPIVVGDSDTAESGGVRTLHSANGLQDRSSFKQINVEILGESGDHNNGQFLKETTILASKPAEPCDDDGKEHGVLITKQEVTTIKPVTVTRLRGSTAARLSTRYKAVGPSSEKLVSTTARPIPGSVGGGVTPKPVSSRYLAPIQAGLRLSNADRSRPDDDCVDGGVTVAPKERTVVEVQKSLNIKNILIEQEKPNQRQYGARTKIIHQPPVYVEKPVDRIVKQPVFIEKPVERIVQKPVFVEKPVPVAVPVERIVEKPVHHTHYVDRPVPVEKKVTVHVPVEKIVEKPVQVEKIVTQEVQVPYPVTQVVDRPVTVEKIVEKPVPVEVARYIDRPYPVEKIVDRPYPVEVQVEKVVEKLVDRPVEVERVVEKHVQVPVPVAVERVVEKFVDRPVPYAVEKIVDRPYPVEKIVEKIVDRPYPVQVPVEVPVQVPVHYPVEVPVGIPIPYPVEKYIALPVHEPKPTHSIIKTVHHEHFDFGKFLAQKKKHFVDHFFPKSHHHPKVSIVEMQGQHTLYHTNHHHHPKNDLHFGASVSNPVLVDGNHLNFQTHYAPEKSQPIYGIPYTGETYAGNFGYVHHQPIVKDDYVGPTPLLEDHWAVKSDVKFRRSPSYGKSLRIEYGGFKPPLVPSVEIDEHGVPLNKENHK